MATSKASAQRKHVKTSTRSVPGESGVMPPLWELRLYVAGITPASVRAFDNLKRICETHLQGVYTIRVIDLVQQPGLASGDQIIAVPTLVRHLPTPVKKIIGDLSNTERVLVGLDLRPAGTSGMVTR